MVGWMHEPKRWVEGRHRTYIFVYAPVERTDRPTWLADFTACMPTSRVRDVMVAGDFNTRMSNTHGSGLPGLEHGVGVGQAGDDPG